MNKAHFIQIPKEFVLAYQPHSGIPLNMWEDPHNHHILLLSDRVHNGPENLSCSFPCTDITISYKDWRMHLYIIHTTLSALCHSNMFQPSKAHSLGVWLIHFYSKINKICTRCTIQFSEQTIGYGSQLNLYLSIRNVSAIPHDNKNIFKKKPQLG